MGIFRLKRKTFTVYDETDNLKRMNDSDILAEQRKTPTTGWGNIASQGLTGAAMGAGLGAAAGAFFGHGAGNMKGGAMAGGKWGAALGGLTMAGMALHKRNQENKQNQFYNNRLNYAQRQARRRERKDWKANMTQRDGYSY